MGRGDKRTRHVARRKAGQLPVAGCFAEGLNDLPPPKLTPLVRKLAPALVDASIPLVTPEPATRMAEMEVGFMQVPVASRSSIRGTKARSTVSSILMNKCVLTQNQILRNT